MADLRSLSLWRNDPQAAARIIKAAQTGDADAQYAAGLIYAEGRGVEQNDALSYFWLSLAHEQGDEDAMLLRNVVAVQISQGDYDCAVVLLARYKSGQFDLSATMNPQ